MTAVAIVVLGPSGLATAGRVREAVRASGAAAEIHGAARRLGGLAALRAEAATSTGAGRLSGDVPGSAGEPAPAHIDRLFDDVAAHLAALFGEGRPIVGICAAGILIRALAPVIRDKTGEPPVIAVAEDGSAVVPLIGTHRGGLSLARAIGAALSVAPAVTTAGDVSLASPSTIRPPTGASPPAPRSRRSPPRSSLAPPPRSTRPSTGSPRSPSG